jgi:hypothetical protein
MRLCSFVAKNRDDILIDKAIEGLCASFNIDRSGLLAMFRAWKMDRPDGPHVMADPFIARLSQK